MCVPQNNYSPSIWRKLDDMCFHLGFATHLKEVTYSLVSMAPCSGFPHWLVERHFQAFAIHESAVGVCEHDAVALWKACFSSGEDSYSNSPCPSDRSRCLNGDVRNLFPLLGSAFLCVASSPMNLCLHSQGGTAATNGSRLSFFQFSNPKGKREPLAAWM